MNVRPRLISVVVAAPVCAALAVIGCSFKPFASHTLACAGGSTAIYQTHARSTTATVYCPTFLPDGFEMASAQPPDLIQPPNVAPYSDVEFRNGEQTIEIIQGNLPIIPRNDAGLPISTPERDVTFGDIPAQLFIEYQRVPLVVFTRSDTAPTRASRAPPAWIRQSSSVWLRACAKSHPPPSLPLRRRQSTDPLTTDIPTH